MNERVLSARRPPLQIVIAGGVGLLLGGAALWSSPLQTLIILGGAGLLVTALKRPEIAVMGYLAFTSSLIAEEQIPAFSIGFGTLYATDFILLGAFSLIVIRWLVEPQFDAVQTPLNAPMICFASVAVVSTAAGILRSSVSFNQSLAELRSVLSYLLFFVVVNLVRSEQQLRLLIKGLCLLACLVAIMMVAQYAMGSASAHIIPGRVESLSIEGQAYGDVTRLIPPGISLVTVMFTVTTAVIGLRGLKATGVPKFLQWLLLGLGLLLTFFRSYWVTTAFSLLILGQLLGQQAKRTLATCGLIVLLLVAPLLLLLGGESDSPAARLAQASADRLLSLGKEETYADSDSSLRERDIEYKYALRQIGAHPILGLGLGAAYRPFIVGRDWRVGSTAFIHNGHLWLMTKIGLAGYASFVWLSAVFLLRGFRYGSQVRTPWMKACVLGFTLAYLATLIVSVVEPTLMYSFWTPVIGVMMGFNEVVYRQMALEKLAEDGVSRVSEAQAVV